MNGLYLDKQLLGNVNGKYALMGAVALRSISAKGSDSGSNVFPVAL